MRWVNGRLDEQAVALMRALDRYRFDLAGHLLIPDVLGRKTVDRLRRVIDAQGVPAADHTLAQQRFGAAAACSPGTLRSGT
jgi:hypothetical protein